MKKTVLSFVAALICCTALCQEADGLGNIAEFNFVSRMDLNPNFTKSGNEVGLGNTSFYTFITVNPTEHLSIFAGNHWLSSAPDELYNQTFFHSDVGNWVDYLNATLTLGNFAITVGKDCIKYGSWEIDPYDHEVHFDLASMFWTSLQSYQWGGSVTYTTNSENTELALQVNSSQFGEKPFEDGLIQYSFRWQGCYWDLFEPSYSIHFDKVWDGRYLKTLCLGNRFDFDKFQLTVDFTTLGADGIDMFKDAFYLRGSVLWSLNDKIDILATLGHDKCNQYVPGFKHTYGGAGIQFYPLNGSKDLQIHAIAACNSYSGEDAFSFTLGAIYNIALNIRR